MYTPDPKGGCVNFGGNLGGKVLVGVAVSLFWRENVDRRGSEFILAGKWRWAWPKYFGRGKVNMAAFVE